MSDYLPTINFYYKTGNEEAIVFNATTNKFKKMSMTDVYKLKKRFFMFKGYECTEGGLKAYATDFFRWVDQIKKDEKFGFDYTKYKSHEDVTMRYFEKLCRTKKDKLLYTNFFNHEDIDSTEYLWIESNNNAGLIYCEAGTYDDCHGYDYSMQYPAIFASQTFRIPTKRGTEQTIKEIPTKGLKMGYYKVKITSNDKRFIKVFGFSKKNVYTNISLIFAMECKTKFNYDINIELIQEPNNCYIYEECITTGNVIFGYWFDIISGLKQRYPNNKLIKNMSSALWGRIAQHNRLFRTEQQCEDEDLDYLDNYNKNHDYYIRSSTFNKKGEEVFELVNCKQPYRYAIARTKPFLLAQSRSLIGKVARKHIDHVVRIHTDNVTFNTEHDDVCFEKDTFKLIKEEKTTGKIHFVRTDCYKHYTNDKYTTKNYAKYENNEIDDENCVVDE